MSNYPEHFGLKQRVFKRDKQAFLYVTDQMRQAEQDFRTAFDESDCVLTVSGPIGSGKSTIVNHALAGLPGKTRVIRLGRVRLAPDEVLELLLTELGIGEPPNGTIRKLGALGDKVARLKSDDTRLVVVVEDATRTGMDTLGELEVICGSDGGFDIGLVVCGDETLPTLLKGEPLRRLSQRISASIVVAPLAVDEMEDYLVSALRGAGGDPSRILSNDVPALLHILSCGIPRLANKLVEAALKKAAAQSGPRVTCALLADIAETQFGITTEIPVKRRPVPKAAKVGRPKPDTPAVQSSNGTASDAEAPSVKSDTGNGVPATAAIKKPEPAPSPRDESPGPDKPESTRPATPPMTTDSSTVAACDAGTPPDRKSARHASTPDDLPYLIQDTQPELVALKPDALDNKASFATRHEHEMLPDLDELAAELAKSNPAPTPAAENPEPSDIPELKVESLADGPAADASLPDPEDSGKAPASSDPSEPVDAVSRSRVEANLPERKAEADHPAAKTEPDLPDVKAGPKLPDLKVAPDLPSAKREPAAADASADNDRPDAQPEVPELETASAPTPSQPSDIAEATPDEAALISALADEHATSQRSEASTTPFEEATVEAVDSPPLPTSAASAEPDVAAAKKDAIVMPEPELETVASADDKAANGDQDPSLQLEVLDDDAVMAPQQPKKGEVVIRDADRDPTLAQLKPDLDALELALAENFVPNGAASKGDDEESTPAEPVPEITLDNSIEKKVSAEAEELARRDAEIAARKKAAEEKTPAKSKLGPSDTDVHKLAADLKRANNLEDMDDRLAETLFGDEINMVAAQVLESAREQAEKGPEPEAPKATVPTPPTAGDDAKIKKQFEDVWGQVPDESEAIDLKGIKPNSGLDMSASQRLATVRALNAGMGAPTPAPVKKKPAKPKDAPVPIEDQIDISMTNTMKALNIDPKVLEQPQETDEAPKGGFFSRFRKKG